MATAKRSSKSTHVLAPQKTLEALTRLQQALNYQTPMSKEPIPFGLELPSLENDSEAFCLDYLLSEFLSKYDDGKSSELKRDSALEKFRTAEDHCRDTNRRLYYDRYHGPFFKGRDPQHVLYIAARKISAILGEFCWNAAADRMGWGPGSTTRLSRRHGNAAYKYTGNPDSTQGNLACAYAVIQHNDLWFEALSLTGKPLVNIVEGNKVITVPKNYKTDRAIAVEPCMNMFVQKGIGSLIRSRLKRWGVDLNSQKRNQDLALIGARDGTLATIDFSMASDTVSHELVRQLLPPDWLDALGQCRSPIGVLPSGERIVYQKFSSMGNGYTFELESLIFYGLALACAELDGAETHQIAVYGDDVIVPSATAPFFLEIASYCGFIPNMKKTFLDGPFRESCGKHYFRGDDVSPFYVRRPLEKVTDVFLLHNNVFRFAQRARLSSEVRASLGQFSKWLRGLVPSKWRKPRLPDGFGDGAFIGTFDECTPTAANTFKKYLWWEGFLVTHLAPVSASYYEDTYGQLIACIDGAGRCLTDPFSALSDHGGGISRPPRVREVTTLVHGFPEISPFGA